MATEKDIELGQRLKICRREMRISADQLAKESGLTRDIIANMESGRTIIDWLRMRKILIIYPTINPHFLAKAAGDPLIQDNKIKDLPYSPGKFPDISKVSFLKAYSVLSELCG